MNYRNYYQELTETVLEKDFDVHHLDGNRNNNHILNLVAIPKVLHRKFHIQKEKYINAINEINDLIYFYSSDNKRYNEIINKYIEIKNKISDYIMIRDNHLHKNISYGRMD